MESSNNLGLNLSTHPIVTDSSYNFTSSPKRNTCRLLCERLCPGGYLQAPSTVHHLPGDCFIHLGAQLGAHILKTLPVQGRCTHFSHSFKSRGQFFDLGFQDIGTTARINILLLLIPGVLLYAFSLQWTQLRVFLSHIKFTGRKEPREPG